MAFPDRWHGCRLLVLFRIWSYRVYDASCEINCLPWDNKPGTKSISENEGRKTFEETLGKPSTQIPRCSGCYRACCWLHNRGRAKKINSSTFLLGKPPSYSTLKCSTRLQCCRISVPTLMTHDTTHSATRWVSLGLDKLWCNSNRMIVPLDFHNALLVHVLAATLLNYFPQSIPPVITLYPFQSQHPPHYRRSCTETDYSLAGERTTPAVAAPSARPK